METDEDDEASNVEEI